MRSEKLIEILKQGVETWNDWRRQNPEVKPDLSDSHLRDQAENYGRHDFLNYEADETQYFGTLLEGMPLTGVDLSDADLSGMGLIKSDLSKANLQRANLFCAWLAETNFQEADLRDADLGGASAIEANLSGADLSNSRLDYADLWGSNLDRAKLVGADLRIARLFRADLRSADLRNANLEQALLTESVLRLADLRNANLRRAYMDKADLTCANLEGANLAYADLRRAVLAGTSLTNVDLKGARIGETVFGNVDLSKAKGLDTVNHEGPSSIGIDTIYRSGGKIPESFLKDAGVPDNFITGMASLTSNSSEFYSCFISYSTKDEEFAKRLHSRLRAANIRVWFAPEDVKGGEKLDKQIERAIQIYDRLLIVLSENSLQSEWVLTEIRKARKAEVKEKRQKLFPIRLVKFESIREWQCFDADTGKDLAVEVREYFIPDFSNWKDDGTFEQSLKRLLDALKAVA